MCIRIYILFILHHAGKERPKVQRNHLARFMESSLPSCFYAPKSAITYHSIWLLYWQFGRRTHSWLQCGGDWKYQTVIWGQGHTARSEEIAEQLSTRPETWAYAVVKDRVVSNLFFTWLFILIKRYKSLVPTIKTLLLRCPTHYLICFSESTVYSSAI